MIKTINDTTQKILVFGIFDGVHPGHIDFFRQAKAHGDFLVVAVGQPSVSQKLKNRLPKHTLEERMRFVRDADYVDNAVPGDKEQGSYEIVLREKPDVICVGYDQQQLAEDLKKWLISKDLRISLKILNSYKSSKYHSSIINGSSQ